MLSVIVWEKWGLDVYIVMDHKDVADGGCQLTTLLIAESVLKK